VGFIDIGGRGGLEVTCSAELVNPAVICADGVCRGNGCEGAMSMELTSALAGDKAHTGPEGSTPGVRRDPEWVETVLTVMATSLVVIMASILAVAMNLT
jgi:hypothetical protein